MPHSTLTEVPNFTHGGEKMTKMSEEEREVVGACAGVQSRIEEAIREFNRRLDDQLGPTSESSSERRINADEGIKELQEWLERFKDKVGVG